MNKYINIFLAVTFVFAVSGCSSEKRPFEARYISPNDVAVTYLGKTYTLNRFSSTADVPFEYSFEPDGDLDLVIDGKEYEVDSPFDIDSKKKKNKIGFSKKTSYKKKPKKK